ncbi:hypothetical protein F5Y16DRAFT_421150 [Xylariaceae sp. FL0255]|nr:hypothetical protein F5Y16DRAFT_421150 [Xylariaceae sp. FL0255]
MKLGTAVLCMLHATAVMTAPAAQLEGPRSVEKADSFYLDCGTPAITALCSAANSGAYCDPITGVLSIVSTKESFTVNDLDKPHIHIRRPFEIELIC